MVRLTRQGLLAAAAAVSLSTPLLAMEPKLLEGEGLQKSVSGRTITISTPVGDLPITYSPDGTMTASSAALGTFTGTTQDTGKWWVLNDQMCQQWSVWLDAKPYCYKMRKDGLDVHWVRNDGATGIARLAPRRRTDVR